MKKFWFCTLAALCVVLALSLLPGTDAGAYLLTPEPYSPPTQRFEVYKTDQDGAPLSGAIFKITPEDGAAGTAQASVSGATGIAWFSAEYGSYVLSEQTAPDGYRASEKVYHILVDASGVYMAAGSGSRSGRASALATLDEYKPITFVNYRIPLLNKTDHFAFIQGYPGDVFGPARNMSRAEVVVMFARLLQEKMVTGQAYASSFSDVTADAWYANEVGYMEKYGIVNGYADGTFRPNAPVTRAEFAAVASRFEKLTAGSQTFSDVPASHWAARYIAFAVSRGWVDGYADGTFHPDQYITRAEVVTVTCRLLERVPDQTYIDAHASALPRTYKDLTAAYWAYYYVMESSNGHDYTKSGTAETWTNTYA